MKKLKSNIIVIALIAMIYFSTMGCSDLKFGDAFLEKPASTELNIDSVFSRKDYAIQALNNAYHTLPDGLTVRTIAWTYLALNYGFLESLTDLNNSTCNWDALYPTYYGGQLSASTDGSNMICNFKNGGHWQGIRMCWQFIDNVDRVPDMTKEEKDLRKGEAKAIIAEHYIHMFRAFGGLPWIGRVYSANDRVPMERMTVEQTVAKIVELLDEAAAVLPWTIDRDNSGRMTKAGVMGLKVRLLLFAASPLFNNDTPYLDGEAATKKLTWYGDKKSARWNDVVKACEDFFAALAQNGGYDLPKVDGNLREGFRQAYFERSSIENLVSSRWLTTYVGVWGGRTFLEMCQYGTGSTSLDYVDMFQMADGTEFDWNNPSHNKYPFFDLNDPTKPRRDPRLYESVLINQDKYQGRTVQSWIGGLERTTKSATGLLSSGFVVRKFRQDITQTAGKFYCWPILRLAEIYLSYAEALNEVNGGPNSLAYDMVLKVRSRVGMPNFKSGLTQSQFREELLRERAREFGYEEVRFYDLIRWKRSDVFQKKLRGLDITKSGPDPKVFKPGEQFTYTQFNLLEPRVWQANWNDKWYLSPFPTTELNLHYGLIQNPGW